MSFSTDVKNEIAKAPLAGFGECLVELASMIRVNGSLTYSSGKINVRFITENNPIARRIYRIFKKNFSYEPTIQVTKNNQLRRKNNYKIIVDDVDVAEDFIRKAGFDINPFALYDSSIPPNLLDSDRKRKAYIRGAFLGSGVILNPDKTYHLEIVTGSVDYATNINNILKGYGIVGKVTERKGNGVLYLKDSEMISDFLSLVGGYQSLLKLEDVRAMKDLKNNINRVINCETANMDKTINASMKQIEAIERIKDVIGLENLPDNLKEIAILRLENPDATLKQLGELADPVISKSGVNHRINKLISISETKR